MNLPECFCQDLVEEYFGSQQRKFARRNDSADIHTFGYNNNTLRIQQAISCQGGNTRGRKDKGKSAGWKLQIIHCHSETEKSKEN